MLTVGDTVSNTAFMVFTKSALAVRGLTGGVPFNPIKAFMTITPKAKMASPARPRSTFFFIFLRGWSLFL